MITLSPVTDSAALRKAFAAFPSGVAAICAHVEGQPAGMAASSFTSVSLDPPLVSVCMQHTSATWPILRDCKRLGLSVLAEDHDKACLQLASKDSDRFAGIEWDRSSSDSVFIGSSTAWFEVSLFDEVMAGDHMIALLEVHGMEIFTENSPLVFHHSKFHRITRMQPNS